MRVGVEVLEEQAGTGAVVERKKRYRVRLRMWLNKGDPISLASPSGLAASDVVEEDGALLTTVEMHRGRTVPGFFYGIEGMRIGGTRKVRIPPNLAYGDRGIPDRIPPNAVLIAELTVLAEAE
jgi:hypothetical protein